MNALSKSFTCSLILILILVAPAVSKERFRGEKQFSLLLKAGLLREEISEMHDGLNILAAQSSLGLCLEARALFVTVLPVP